MPVSHAIRGRVATREGAPVPGATVLITGGSVPFNEIAAVTGADGSFALGGLAAGTFDLTALHPDLGTARASVRLGGPASGDAELVLDPRETPMTTSVLDRPPAGIPGGPLPYAGLAQGPPAPAAPPRDEPEAPPPRLFLPAALRWGGLPGDPPNPRPVGGYIRGPLVVFPPGGQGPGAGGLVVEEVVIGSDERVRVPSPELHPYSVHGHMRMRFPDGSSFIGTGTLVGPHQVLTAGHCVFQNLHGGFAAEVTFAPGQNDTSTPFGTATATRLFTVPQWELRQDSDWDMGMLILDRDVGVVGEAGHLGLRAFEVNRQLNDLRVNVTGYPGDKGGTQMWTHADVVRTVSAERFTYDIDTAGGQSGSGVWTVLDGETVVVGIHTTGSLSGNGAVRLTAVKLDVIREWMEF